VEREVARSGAKMDLQELFRFLDYTEYGGAPLLGVNGISIICHGGSPPQAIKNAIRVAIRAVETNMVDHVRRKLTGSMMDGNGEGAPQLGRIAEGA